MTASTHQHVRVAAARLRREPGSFLLGGGTGRWAPAAVSAALMLGLSVWGIGRGSMYGSEADTYWAAQLGFGSLFHLLGHVDAVHGLYYLFMHAWLQADTSVVAMRLPSALAMSGAAALTTIIATRLSGSRLVGLVAGVLFAFTPFIDDYAQNGRSYGLVCLCVGLTVLALLRALDAPGRWSRWLGYGGLVTLTGYLHEMTLLLALSFAVTLVIARTPRPVMARWLATTVIAGALVSPLLLISLRESKAVGYLRPPDWASVQTLVKVDFGLSDTVAYSLLGCALVAAVPLRHTWTGQRAGSVTLAALAMPMLVIPPAVLMVESRVGNPVYDVRYVLYGAMAAAMLAASGLHRIGRGLAAWIPPARRRTAVVAVPALGACVCAVIVQWPIQQYVRTVASRHQDFGGASNYLAHAHTQTGDGVLFMPRSVRSAELGYPAPYRNLDDLALARTPERAGTFLGVDRSPRAIRIAIERHARIWVVGQYPLRGSAHASPGAARLLRTEYHPTVIGRFTGADVVLYVKGRP